MNLEQIKSKLAIVILAYSDYESLELALATHAKFSTQAGIKIYILQNGFDVKYTKANLIGYILGVINSFFWNKLWVFQKKDGKFIREALLFLLIFGICYSLQYICLIVFVEELYLSENWSQLFSMGIYTVANYILNRCITFKMPSQI